MNTGSCTSLGDDIIAGTYDNSSDEELMSVLENFQTTCESYATERERRNKEKR